MCLSNRVYSKRKDQEVIDSHYDNNTNTTYDTLYDRLNAQSSQILGNTALLGFNFEQQGGIPNDESPAIASANSALLNNLMNICNTMGIGTVSFTGKLFYFAKTNEQYISQMLSNVNIAGSGKDKTILKCISENSTTSGYSFFYNLSDGIDNVHYHDLTIDMYNQAMSGVYSSGGKAGYIRCTSK